MSAAAVRVAFEPEIANLPLDALVPLKQITPAIRKSSKYQQIAASVAALGVIEPLVVARIAGNDRQFLLLDGHLRLTVLIEQRFAETRCLIANDDEAFTYNKRINRLATIQEHLMIVRALERGVSEDRLAQALNLDVRAIKRRRTMLVGVCPEVVDLLKDRSVNPTTFAILRKMRPMRQIESAELMAAAGNYSATYAKALLAATRQNDLVKSSEPKRVGGLSTEQMARMEREMETLQQDMKSVEVKYGDDILHLVIATAYLSKLTSNTRVNRYLGQHHPELLAEFSSIISLSTEQSQV